MPNYIPSISPQILHKSNADDVFIRNPRLLLPSIIPAVELRAGAATALQHSGLYRAAAEGDSLVFALQSNEVIPGYYEVIDVARPDEASSAHQPSEELNLSPSQLMKSADVGLPFALMYEVINSANHYYFYRKEHEHVPGLMLIEIARQAMYHYFYSSYLFHHGQVSISMSSLTVKFDEYTESSLPLMVVVSQNSRKFVPSPKYIDLNAEFFQRGRRVGSVGLAGGVMQTALFKRLRRFEPDCGKWFAPFSHLDMPVLLQGEDGAITDGYLRTISSLAAVIEVRGRSRFDLSQARSILIPTRSLGCIVLMISTVKVDEASLYVEFDQMPSASKLALGEFIKRYCRLSEEHNGEFNVRS